MAGDADLVQQITLRKLEAKSFKAHGGCWEWRTLVSVRRKGVYFEGFRSSVLGEFSIRALSSSTLLLTGFKGRHCLQQLFCPPLAAPVPRSFSCSFPLHFLNSRLHLHVLYPRSYSSHSKPPTTALKCIGYSTAISPKKTPVRIEKYLATTDRIRDGRSASGQRALVADYAMMLYTAFEFGMYFSCWILCAVKRSPCPEV